MNAQGKPSLPELCSCHVLGIKPLNACSFPAKNTTGTGMYTNATNTGLMPQKQHEKPQILLRAEAYVIYLRNKNIFLPDFPKMEACTGVQGIS
ncbi:hypothetical protein HMPREF0733_10829 [Rothia dentocariosa ATCC 17931]|uniref:Uncharacterized protein n=1 Tax=Rothia dentocariosa (strain ATCC 17931 / CDC X599 / XDIA) TaxID=762948 RepID=E3H2L8_ROTDC|nr:hypothetical protein HMPREF0733_10829 [Rothia dentocariosa ATCC 17931]